MTSVKRQRESNLDLLRIASMLLIVLLHSIDHSGVLENAENCSMATLFYVRFTYMLCQVCVNIYVMLSGYFMVNSNFKLHKLAKLWMEAVFYSLSLKLLFMATGKETFSLVSLASCLFPVVTGRYWFLTIYVGMYLLSPFINALIRTLDKRQHALLNVMLFFLMSVWVSIHPAIAGMNSGGGWGLAWFVVLYLAAAWLRLYYMPSGKPFVFFVGYVAIPFAITIAQTVLGEGANVCVSGTLAAIVGHWFRYDSAPVYIMTICLFVGFVNIKIRNKKLSATVVSVAPLTLGVYLIHTHADVSPWCWGILNLPARMNTAMFPVAQLIGVINIFVVCAIIDALRKATIGRIEESRMVVSACDCLQYNIIALFDKRFRSNQ